ncbi:hypothetical protein [Sphingomonas changbaiensis]|nr:hypothetical protein [Sphingomonas changbaiensis]
MFYSADLPSRGRKYIMGVRIEAADGAKLKLSGDVEVTIELPLRAVREGFALAFSDGTLVRGDYDFGAQSCAFEVAIEGAAAISIARENGRKTLEIGWPIEWISVGAGDDTICANDQDVHGRSAQLPLDIEARVAA